MKSLGHRVNAFADGTVKQEKMVGRMDGLRMGKERGKGEERGIDWKFELRRREGEREERERIRVMN